MGNTTITNETQQNTRKKQKIGIENFELIETLSKSVNGEVFLVQKKETKELYAMKVLLKEKLQEEQQIKNVKNERKVLVELDHPFIISLKYSFQTSTHLFLLTEYATGGDLYGLLNRESEIHESLARILISEVILALEYIHSKGIAYRDLKPENILIDQSGHIKICDFGLARFLGKRRSNKTKTFCGSPEYLSPEIIKHQPYGRETDLWSLGIVLYEILHRLPPFYSTNRQVMYKKILNAPIKFSNRISEDAKSLISCLLIREPMLRLGTGKKGFENIKKHSFFYGVDWNKVYEKEYETGFSTEPKEISINRDENIQFDLESVLSTQFSFLKIHSNNSKKIRDPFFKHFDYNYEKHQKQEKKKKKRKEKRKQRKNDEIFTFNFEMNENGNTSQNTNKNTSQNTSQNISQNISQNVSESENDFPLDFLVEYDFTIAINKEKILQQNIYQQKIYQNSIENLITN
ncbi:non-specific serine/threonine protein kinase [Anaeramoeba ignava]|uniref:Non-specific serine/threonine protein kinase n=1 Tax=Anaeramoeba ignava TaxID=1746090 RepID=A0A9Q0LWR4_ANAIG|nr:non-specific serine/threonine protein kinase [Anaeramoeba ignava]